MTARWQKTRIQPNHADDWLMTYADMITLLLCFFAIFLSISIPRKSVPHKVEMAQAVRLPMLPTEDVAVTAPAKVEQPPAQPVAARIEAEASPVVAVQAPSQTTAGTRAYQPEIVDAPKLPAAKEIEPKSDRITTLEMGSAV